MSKFLLTALIAALSVVPVLPALARNLTVEGVVSPAWPIISRWSARRWMW
jgi:hypothetical protein